jgi:hypothetical protein
VSTTMTRDWVDFVSLAFSGALVAIGTFGVVYAIRSLKAIERQAKANEGQLAEIKAAGEQTKRMIEHAGKQADAAFLNAHAVVNAERPWMLINMVVDVGQVGTDPPVSLSVSFINQGRTPAEIISFEQHLDCKQSTGDLPTPPVYSTPEGQVLLHTAMVAPGREWKDRGESSFALSTNFTAEQWQDIRSGRQRALYWGRLRYRDLIEEPRTVHEIAGQQVRGAHETCFCYFYSPALREFLITGPYGYNKHT